MLGYFTIMNVKIVIERKPSFNVEVTVIHSLYVQINVNSLLSLDAYFVFSDY